MYKAIIFDLDNTLLNYTKSEWLSMQTTVQTYGLIDQHELRWEDFWRLYQKINLDYWNDRIQSGFTIYQILEHSFQDTLKQLNIDHSDSHKLAHMYWETFCSLCHFENYATDLLTQLHGKYSLGVITNGIGEAQRSRLAVGEIDHYFQTLVISDEVGYWKPEKEIFDKALNELEVSNGEALYIGDSLQDDFAGAANAGIDFCYYNPNGKKLNNNVQPKYMIDGLEQVITVLTKSLSNA